ncbi:hypothetical protein HMY34_04350 [Thiothrix subterranea]|uniref:hypothetical protein n=1 Tax=Thiothrix subterranea TaxID=2735563 RepID=UPI00192BF472|nr:hypothetical protein [Thiothrix subterranea]QQZ28047.1 hypothetical protein HMY34_04350 [Thiothrix subterranea]
MIIESPEVMVAVVSGVFGLLGMIVRHYLHPSNGTGRPPHPSPSNETPPQRGSDTFQDSNRVYPAAFPKSAGKAALISFFIPGTGEFYLGQTKRAILTFVVSLVLGGGSFGTLWFCVGIISSIHAYKIGSILAKGAAVSEWE